MKSKNGIAVCMIDAGIERDDAMGSRVLGVQKILDINSTYTTYSAPDNKESLTEDIISGLGSLSAVYTEPTPLLLHIGCAGGVRGINFASNEAGMGWRELIDIIAQANDAFDISAILCLSSHKPFKTDIMDALEEGETPPFRMLVGNDKKVAWTDAMIAYMSFYHMLHRYGSVGMAMNAMREASGNRSFYLRRDPSQHTMEIE